MKLDLQVTVSHPSEAGIEHLSFLKSLLYEVDFI